jgi:hypothetical protein
MVRHELSDHGSAERDMEANSNYFERVVGDAIETYRG